MIQNNSIFLSKFGEGFTCTDLDNFQFGKELSDNKFRFVEIDRSTLLYFLVQKDYMILILLN